MQRGRDVPATVLKFTMAGGTLGRPGTRRRLRSCGRGRARVTRPCAGRPCASPSSRRRVSKIGCREYLAQDLGLKTAVDGCAPTSKYARLAARRIGIAWRARGTGSRSPPWSCGRRHSRQRASRWRARRRRMSPLASRWRTVSSTRRACGRRRLGAAGQWCARAPARPRIGIGYGTRVIAPCGSAGSPEKATT